MCLQMHVYVCCSRTLERLPIPEQRLFIRLMAALLLTGHRSAVSPSSMESFSPSFPLAHTYPKAVLGMMIFMLALPLQSCQSFLKKFFNLSFELCLSQYTPVAPKCANDLQSRSYCFHVFWQQLKDIFQFALSKSHSSDLSNTVRHFINHYFVTSNDRRTAYTPFSQPHNLHAALQSAAFTGAAAFLRACPASNPRKVGCLE